MKTSLSIGLAIAAMVLAMGQTLTAAEGQAYLIVYPDYDADTGTRFGAVKDAGHAGVLLVSPTGVTKYYEFGRYNGPDGLVRQRTIPNVKMQNGEPTNASLAAVMASLSKQSGHDGKIQAARFLHMDFDAMNKFASTKTYKKYSIAGANCAHYAEAVILKGHPKIDRPTIINPTPANFVDEYIEEGNSEVLWNPANPGKVTIGPGDESDAKE